MNRKILSVVWETIRPYLRIKYFLILIVSSVILWIPFVVLFLIVAIIPAIIAEIGGIILMNVLLWIATIWSFVKLVKMKLNEENKVVNRIRKYNILFIIFGYIIWMTNIFPIIIGLLYTSLPMRGKIIDIETKKPITNAIINSNAENDIFGLAFGNSEYLESKSSRSNETGEYFINGRIHITPWPNITPGEEKITVYAKGYVGETYFSPSLVDILSKLSGRYYGNDLSGNRRWWKSIWTLGHRDIYLKPLRTKEEAKHMRYFIRKFRGYMKEEDWLNEVHKLEKIGGIDL